MQAPTAPLAGRYRFKAKVDAGTKAPTWLATDDQSRKDVVASALGAARVAALMGVVGLRHQHLAAIMDVVDNAEAASVPGGTAASVVVAEYVSGKTLHAQLKQARLTPAEAVTLWIRLCRGASALHASGGAHGAISPRSIVIEPGHGRPPPILTQLLSPTSGAYCAPERLQGRGPSSADDTWALHATLFAALSGSPPFRGDTKDQLLQSIASGQHGRLADYGIHDEALEEIVVAGLIANLSRRRTSVDQMIEALERWEPKSERSRQATEWEEDAATVVAQSSEEIAAKMAAERMPSPQPPPHQAGPSLPPVAVDDHAVPPPAVAPEPDNVESTQLMPEAQENAELPQANPPDDEEDQTTVMEKPPAVAALPGPVGAPRAPPPPGFASAGGGEAFTAQATPVPYAQPQEAPGAYPAGYGQAPGYQAGASNPAGAFTPAAQGYAQPLAAFPPPTSAFPPSIPAPAPTGIQVSLDDVEFRKPSRGPLIVIAVLLVVIALGMAVALILNYRGVITLWDAPRQTVAGIARG
jgi:serine/threonine protein kinase